MLLPLAIGIDLIILPGPQVLTYYTSWTLYRNASGATGAWQRAAFVTQSGQRGGGGEGGSGEGGGVRVDFVPDARLDAAHDAVRASRDGVLPEDAIAALVAALREPSLEEPLRELRRQRLRKSGRAAGDGGGRYAPLAAGDDDGAGAAAASASATVGHSQGGGDGWAGHYVSDGAGSTGAVNHPSQEQRQQQEQERRQQQQQEQQQQQQQRQPSEKLVDID